MRVQHLTYDAVDPTDTLVIWEVDPAGQINLQNQELQ